MVLSKYDERVGEWLPYEQTDHEAREWARDYGVNDSWYWSPKWRAFTSITEAYRKLSLKK